MDLRAGCLWRSQLVDCHRCVFSSCAGFAITPNTIHDVAHVQHIEASSTTPTCHTSVLLFGGNSKTTKTTKTPKTTPKTTKTTKNTPATGVTFLAASLKQPKQPKGYPPKRHSWTSTRLVGPRTSVAMRGVPLSWVHNDDCRPRNEQDSEKGAIRLRSNPLSSFKRNEQPALGQFVQDSGGC